MYFMDIIFLRITDVQYKCQNAFIYLKEPFKTKLKVSEKAKITKAQPTKNALKKTGKTI